MPVTNAYGKPLELEAVKGCVGPGWGSLVEDLYKLCDANNIMITQVKEKFGGLRFYIGGASAEILDEIEKAENESYKICERCGEPGKPKADPYWIQTLCDKCRKERRK